MSIDWDDYEVYEPGVAGPLRALPRAEARAAFARCMETKAARIEELRRLLRANGVELGREDLAIQALNHWFTASVQADPDQEGWLLPSWYSIVHDIAVFLGEVMIERHPNLHWELFIWGKSNVAFHRHVIMGFGTEDPKLHTNIDIERFVAAYAHRIIESRGSIPAYGTVTVRGTQIDVDAISAQHRADEIESDAFTRWLQTAAQRA